MTKKLKPVHPGEVLTEYRGKMSLLELAERLRVPFYRVSGIESGIVNINADMALRLSRYFRTTARFWINMQISYELEMAEDAVGAEIKRLVAPRRKK